MTSGPWHFSCQWLMFRMERIIYIKIIAFHFCSFSSQNIWIFSVLFYAIQWLYEYHGRVEKAIAFILNSYRIVISNRYEDLWILKCLIIKPTNWCSYKIYKKLFLQTCVSVGDGCAWEVRGNFDVWLLPGVLDGPVDAGVE